MGWKETFGLIQRGNLSGDLLCAATFTDVAITDVPALTHADVGAHSVQTSGVLGTVVGAPGAFVNV